MVNIVKQDFNKNVKKFNKIQKNLKHVLGETTPVDHVGSTAIPNMSGKNIIDVLIGAKNLAQFNEFIEKIINLGYYPSEKSKTEEYQFFASKKEETISGDTHIHLVLIETKRYDDFLILKNYLLNHPEVCKLYIEKKQELSKNSREEYRRLKSEIVNKIINMARETR